MDSRLTIGPGNIEMCRRCVEKRKGDIDKRIADKVEKMCLPSEIFDNELHDLIKMRQGQFEDEPTVVYPEAKGIDFEIHNEWQ